MCLTELEEMYLNLKRLNDALTGKDKEKEWLRLLPEYLGFIALITSANDIASDSIYNIFKTPTGARKGLFTPIASDILALLAAGPATQKCWQVSDDSRRLNCFKYRTDGHNGGNYRKMIRK